MGGRRKSRARGPVLTLSSYDTPFPGNVKTPGNVEFAHCAGRNESQFYPCRPGWDARPPDETNSGGFYNVSYTFTTKERHRPTPRLVGNIATRPRGEGGAEATSVGQHLDVVDSFRKMKAHGRLQQPPPCNDMFGHHNFGRAGRSAPSATPEQVAERARQYEMEMRRLRQESTHRPASAGPSARGPDFSRCVGRRKPALGTPRDQPEPGSAWEDMTDSGTMRLTTARSRRPVSAPSSRWLGTDAVSGAAGSAHSVARARRQRVAQAEQTPRLLTMPKGGRRTLQHYEWMPDTYPSAATTFRVETPAPMTHAQRDRHVSNVRLGATSGRTVNAPSKRNAEWLSKLLKRRARAEAEQEALRGDFEVTNSTFKRPRSGMSMFLQGSREDMPIQGLRSEEGEAACAREAVSDAEALCHRVTLDARVAREMGRLKRKNKTGSPATPPVGGPRANRADRIFSPQQLARVQAENAKYTEAPMGSSAYGIHYRQAQQEQQREEALNAEVRDVLAAAGADAYPTPTHADRHARRIFSDEDT
eukprot:Hpha_TRINITY_DN3539_c0_g1::TRINITY_DN3539_c0_g1_i1::g.25751::m.25751